MFNLKPFQILAVESLVRSGHTLLISPTGSGKSLVFLHYLSQVRPASRAIVVSPLNALARQHADRFEAFGIPKSLGVGSGGSGPPSGRGAWIVNPEKLSGQAMRALGQWAPDLLIVDEAHCVWEWGESFRPAFRSLTALITQLGIERSFWCTATLPSAAHRELRASLGSPLRTLGLFSLPESLKLKKIHSPLHERIEGLRSLIESHRKDSGMIFVNTRSSAERIQKYLVFWGVRSFFYHAGMSAEERVSLEKLLSRRASSDPPLWVVATSAFGMGMDYSWFSVCVLFEPSFSLLALAQALGRVGRSGREAQAYLLWHPDDFLRHPWFGAASNRNRSRLIEVKQWFESPGCPRFQLEKYFNEGYDQEDEHTQ